MKQITLSQKLTQKLHMDCNTALNPQRKWWITRYTQIHSIIKPNLISNIILQTKPLGQLTVKKQNYPTALQTENVSQKSTKTQTKFFTMNTNNQPLKDIEETKLDIYENLTEKQLSAAKR